MVESWTTSPDGLTWRFTLRVGQKFHDGAPVAAADVTASLKRWMQKDIVGQRLGAVTAGMDAIDDKTFELKLKQPVAYTLLALGSAIGQVPFIMRAKDIEALDPTKPLITENGSGPFSYDPGASVSGDRVVFEKNADYVPRSEPPDGLAGGRIVKVDRVVWKIIPDPSTAATALQLGEVDLVEQPSLDLVPVLAKNRDVRLQKLTEMANQVLLRPNSLNPPFNDPRARLALAYLTDQSDILAAGFGDPRWWHPCDAYFVCGGPYGNAAGAADYNRINVEKAKQLLAEAGYHGEKLISLRDDAHLPMDRSNVGSRRAGTARGGDERRSAIPRLGERHRSPAEQGHAREGRLEPISHRRQRADDALAADQYRHRHDL
jgi:peptide/nickel transport system substrate-binding protein